MKATTLHHHDESSSNICLFCKKATVHLNNLGVSLLHRGCLRQTIETFTDALAVAQLGCQHTKHNIVMNYNDRLASTTLLTQHDSVDTRKILEKAYDRLSHPEPSTLCGIELKVISDDESPAGIQSCCLVVEEETESSINIRKENVVIHMNHLNVNIPTSEEEDAIQCSIICYNNGTAYLCLSTLPAASPFVDKLYMGALKMFQLAFSTLTSLHLVKEKLQSCQMNRVLITGLFVLHNLILLSTTLGMAKERADYVHEFCDFSGTIPSPAARAA